MIEEVDPMRTATSRVRMREGLSGRRAKRPEDVTFGTPAIVDLLPGALGLRRSGPHQGFPLIALGRDWSHLIQADHEAARRGRGVERLDPPLFSAKAGSTRSPNQVSCFRQRKPSVIRISSRRLRCIAIPFSSWR
jgi:hypothetical protein